MPSEDSGDLAEDLPEEGRRWTLQRLSGHGAARVCIGRCDRVQVGGWKVGRLGRMGTGVADPLWARAPSWG